jgi:hypothetical protein
MTGTAEVVDRERADATDQRISRALEAAGFLPETPDDIAAPGESIRVAGERADFARTLVPSPYPRVPGAVESITTMQAEAREYVRSGRSHVLRAPTSSGKTISFAAPIFESGQSAVFVYPYRALLLDQAFELLRVARWFGYGPDDFGYLMGGVDRREIAAQIEGRRFLLATPDKLVSLLMAGREGTMAALRVLSTGVYVFDEAHAYSEGMTKSVICFLRSARLWQDARGQRGKSPTFIFSSATIPPELARELEEGIGISPGDSVTGPSNTGNVTLEISAPRASKDTRSHPVAVDMADRGATTNAVAVLGSPFAAWQVCRSPELRTTSLLFVGQDKQAERERRAHLRSFSEAPHRYALVGSNAIEAGVDLAAGHLFMETGTADSTVQRFGRAARAGRDADVMIYGAELRWAQGAGLLRNTYTRSEFNRLLALIHPVRPRSGVLTALAAAPYVKFWGNEAHRVVDPEDMAVLDGLRAQGVPALLAFRSLTPYTSYESGERIGFSSLFRKSLTMDGQKVTGAPNTERYFMAESRKPVIVELLKVAHRQEICPPGSPGVRNQILLAHADFGDFGRHWTMLDLGPGGAAPPDNMIVRMKGRTLTGPGTANFARFYGG